MLSYLFMCNVDYIQLSKTLLLLQTNGNALVVRFLMKDLRKGVQHAGFAKVFFNFQIVCRIKNHYIGIRFKGKK